MKIEITSRGTATPAVNDEAERDIRSALRRLASDEAADDFVAGAVIMHCLRGLDLDAYAVIAEDDDTELWRGWLNGSDEPAPLDPEALSKLAHEWESAALGLDSGNAAEVDRKAQTLRVCARQLREALGRQS